VIRRRAAPLVPLAERGAYQRLVREAFRGDRLLPAIRQRLPAAHRWLTTQGLDKWTRPGELNAERWAALYGSVSSMLEP
jgi:23S rRNA (adenine-N6)-dimethyltransferase